MNAADAAAWYDASLPRWSCDNGLANGAKPYRAACVFAPTQGEAIALATAELVCTAAELRIRKAPYGAPWSGWL